MSYGCQQKRGTQIYILCARSAANSVEWLTFLRTALGWHRPDTLQVYVPGLSLTLQLEKPFEKLEAIRDTAVASGNGGDELILQAMIEEQAVAGNIIRRCMKNARGKSRMVRHARNVVPDLEDGTCFGEDMTD